MKILRFVGIIAFIYCSFTLIAQTTVTCPVIGTASVYSGFPNSNFSGLAVGDYDNEEFRCLVVFDLSAIPPNSDVLDAEMRLTYSQTSDYIGVDLHRISSSWSANSVTWNNFPAYITNPYGTFWTSNGTIGYSIYIPVDEIVEEWIENGESNWGILLKKGGGTGMAEFFSTNASPSQKPELEVTVVPLDYPEFYDVDIVNGIDVDNDGYYEQWDFEVDIDASNGGIAEDVYIEVSGCGNYWIFGPFDFEGYATWDNQIIGPFFMEDCNLPYPQYVEFHFHAYNQYGNDDFYLDVPVDAIESPQLYVNPTNINLGTHPPGYPFNASFIVKNTGTGTLTGNIYEYETWISSLSPSSFNLGPDDEITIDFSGNFPSNIGPFSGNIDVYSNGGDDEVYVHGVVSVEPLAAPTNLEATVDGNDVHLNWDAPGDELWIQWDNGENTSAVGLTNGGTFSVASHWDPDDLTDYNGYILSKISFFPNDENATYILKVWTGPSGTTEVLSQPLATFNVGEWNEVELCNPVTINASTDFWFGYETTHLAGNYPAGCDAGPAIQYKGDMISTGGAWESLYVLTGGALDYNWNIAGWISMFDGETTSAQPMVKENALVYNNGSFTAISTGTVKPKAFNPTGSKYLELLGYNVYRDGSNIAYVAAPTTEYDDIDLPNGQYEYYVTAVWDEGESDPSNIVTVDVITAINEVSGNTIQIYPNPAKDKIFIKSTKSELFIEKLELLNMIGKAVYQSEKNKIENLIEILVVNFNPGIYFVKLHTSEGIITRKIIIQH